MELEGKVAIVTGGGGGIGAALAAALGGAGASVAVADLDADAAERAAAAVSGRAFGAGVDVADEVALRALIERTESELGPVDVFCANAGIMTVTGLDTPDAEWARALDVNVLAHVRAARLLVPGWIERDAGGYFVATASAAGLLTQVGSPAYSVTKHGAVAFAEWLSVTYGDRGVRVSCICPMGVNTGMLNAGLDAADGGHRAAAEVVVAAGRVVEPEDVAAEVLAAMAAERFLVLPHPEVLEFFRRKGSDYDRWLAGMRRLQASVAS